MIAQRRHHRRFVTQMVDVDIDLSDFSDKDLMEELTERGACTDGCSFIALDKAEWEFSRGDIYGGLLHLESALDKRFRGLADKIAKHLAVC